MARCADRGLMDTLSLVIPAFNESERLVSTLEAVADYLVGASIKATVIVVDDGSTDGTADVVFDHMSEASAVDVIAIPRQLGKGAAVRAGVLASDAEVIGFMDADMSTPIEELPRVLAPLNDGYDISIGSRAMTQSRLLLAQPTYRRVGARIFREIVPFVVGLHGFPDSQCGFKFFRREVAHDLFGATVIERWMFDAEVLRLATHRGYRVAQVPVTWRNHPDSRLRLTLDTYRMIRDLTRIRLRFMVGRYGRPGRVV